MKEVSIAKKKKVKSKNNRKDWNRLMKRIVITNASNNEYYELEGQVVK